MDTEDARTGSQPLADEAAHGFDGPRVVLPPVPLEPAERRRVALVALAPVPAVAVLLLPFVLLGRTTFGNVLAAALVYGSLLSLAAGFVMVDREQSRQCPRCRSRNARRVATCAGCGYDLATRPRYVCEERHRVHLDPGLCSCGRRLARLGTGGGIGREVVVILKAGVWLLAFLVGMGLLLRFAG